MNPWSSSLPLAKRHSVARCVCIYRRLVHQLDPGGRDNKLSRHLNAHRILQSQFPWKIVQEEYCALIAKLPRAVPAAPERVCVVQVETANAIELFRAGRNRILDHKVTPVSSDNSNTRHYQITRMNLTR